MSTFTLQAIARLIAQRTGIMFRDHDYGSLRRKLEQRMQALGLQDLESYYSLLLHADASIATPSRGSGAIAPPPQDQRLNFWSKRVNPESKLTPGADYATEWQHLVDLITVCESYFLRDRNQFSLLQNTLIPAIIDRKKQMIYGGRPRLRLWSAGCSTGEEPYSLAILLQETLDLSQWDVMILATDICGQSLAKARSGIFGSWSFRQFDPSLKEKYFQPHPQGWKINPSLQTMVFFQSSNLVADEFPQVGGLISEIDIILCRNVFIYFDSHAINLVIRKFAQTLIPQGYLITGHAELQGQNLDSLQPISFPESVIYQRQDLITSLPSSTSILGELPGSTLTPSAGISPPIAPTPSLSYTPRSRISPPRPKASTRTGNLPGASSRSKTALPSPLAQARALLASEQYKTLASTLETLLREWDQGGLGSTGDRLEAQILLAQAQANLGHSSQARQTCQEALKLDPCSTQVYSLLAQLAEESGDLEGAKLFLKRVIYLDPDAVMAYFNLGLIYERENTLDRARKVHATTWDLVRRMAPHTIVDPEQKRTARDLQIYLEQKLEAKN